MTTRHYDNGRNKTFVVACEAFVESERRNSNIHYYFDHFESDAVCTSSLPLKEVMTGCIVGIYLLEIPGNITGIMFFSDN